MAELLVRPMIESVGGFYRIAAEEVVLYKEVRSEKGTEKVSGEHIVIPRTHVLHVLPLNEAARFSGWDVFCSEQRKGR